MKKGTVGSIGDGVVFLAKHLTAKKEQGQREMTAMSTKDVLVKIACV